MHSIRVSILIGENNIIYVFSLYLHPIYMAIYSDARREHIHSHRVLPGEGICIGIYSDARREHIHSHIRDARREHMHSHIQ